MVRMPDTREAPSSDFNAIRISIASPDQIRAWSSGEVQKGETINYRTQRPEKDGLFCEKIFGPTKDWECQCGKYKRQKYKGVVCDRCGVEVTRANVRRQRLGHIALAAPVANIWFVKNTPSVMSLALDLKLSDLTRVLYYSAYVITQVDIDLMRAQLSSHGVEVEQLREGPLAVGYAAWQRIVDRVEAWALESRLHEAASAIVGPADRLPRTVPNAKAALSRLVSHAESDRATPAEESADADNADSQALLALATDGMAAARAAGEVGRLLLAEGVVDSPEKLALAAIEGDPVAKALSLLHHGGQPITDALSRQAGYVQAVVDAFAAWRAEPAEEARDNLDDAADRLRDDIAAVHDELLLPALGDLNAAVTQLRPLSFGTAAQQPLSDDLAEIRRALAEVEQSVRSWNYRRADDNPDGRGWNLPAFNALLERLSPDSVESQAIDELEQRIEFIHNGASYHDQQEEIVIWHKRLPVLRDLVSLVGDYLLRALAERRKEAVDIIQAMRWLRWDPTQRPRAVDLDWLWDDLKLPAAARHNDELPDEFYIARSGSAGLRLTTLSTSRYDRLKPFWGDAFDAEMGSEPTLEFLKLLDLDLDQERYYTELEMRATSAQIRTKAGKRMRLLETFRRSENRMQDMIMTVLPVLPPELRPMVQLDGGRFATSDLNDLYRRVLSRNHRLKRFASMRAPSLMIRNEKRMLQEAVDSLIDNGRQGKPVKGKRDHTLKSLSDLLKGKQGRFRQNLLGKRVDYSGRSVIVVGPELKMDECGLPKRMALELFKPFVMHRLVLNSMAPNIKAAKRMVERSSPEVWQILEDVIKNRPVMLNRAPTLHRLGIQAFKPVLIEGSAIQLHPLVCSAFNADFDGDQMAVHVPLSAMAVNETGSVMLSINNMLSPASGDPLVAPTLDMVMGCYYLTEEDKDAKGAGGVFYDIHEARIAYSEGLIDLRAPVTVLCVAGAEGRVETTMGRLIFNETIPDALGFKNHLMDRAAIKDLTSELYRNLSNQETARALDRIKEMGFYYATKSGITIAINDIQVSERKQDILADAGHKVAEHEDNFMMGMMTEAEKYERVIETWTQASDAMEKMVQEGLENNSYGGVAVMAKSGAKGNISQIKQMAGMRGLMSDPGGYIIERPVKSSFREGLTALEYFISTHGARKGLTDTALRTADSGYLTRRLVDVSQEVIVQEYDCEFAEPFYVEPRPNGSGGAGFSAAESRHMDLPDGSGGASFSAIESRHMDLPDLRFGAERRFGKDQKQTSPRMELPDLGAGMDELFSKVGGILLSIVEQITVALSRQISDDHFLEKVQKFDITAAAEISNPRTDEIIVRQDEVITPEIYEEIKKANKANAPGFFDEINKIIHAEDEATREAVTKATIEAIIDAHLIKEIPMYYTSGLKERIAGRIAGDVIAAPRSGEIIVDRNEMIDEEIAEQIAYARIYRVPVRSPLTCQTRRGICQLCYGRLPATGQLVEIGQAVGVIAAQSIGEPGTQLTMRTFHTGGIAGSDITTGLPRVQELFEVRPPKGAGVLTHIDGMVSIEEDPNGSRRIRVIYDEEERHEYPLPEGAIRLVERGEPVAEGSLLAVVVRPDALAGAAVAEADAPDTALAEATDMVLADANVVQEIRSEYLGEAEVSDDRITVVWREEESRAYDVSNQMSLKVQDGQQVMAGDALVDGPLDLRELLDIRGVEGLQHYLVDEVQEVYRSQGVGIHDKHIEVILRQMLRRVQVETAGDTEFISGDVVDKFRFQDQNAQVFAEGGEPATAKTLLLGVSKAALTTDSFLSKASFQETTKVLTMAAVASDRDWLRGLKENVIIGRLIPARLESLLDVENAFALGEGQDEYESELVAPWLYSDGEMPEGLVASFGRPPLDAPGEAIDDEIISGQPLSPFGGIGLGDAGYQIRTAEEEDESLRRAQSLTDSDSEIDREVEAAASRIFSPFDDDADDHIPQL